jgi:hypothetical protein
MQRPAPLRKVVPEVEFLDSVAVEDIPREAERVGNKGVWTGLAQHAINDTEKGQVTVIKLADEDAYKRMRNGVSEYLRRAGYTLDAVMVKEDDGLRIYMKLKGGGRT